MRDYPSEASNIKFGQNPEFEVDDFFQMYPQFVTVPLPVVKMYLDMGHENVQIARWHSKWLVGISLFVAHHLTLWAKTSSEGISTMGELAISGENKGAVMSKGVDGVSISYGQTSGDSDMQGWGSYRDTIFGQQFITLAKTVSHGGMYVV